MGRMLVDIASALLAAASLCSSVIPAVHAVTFTPVPEPNLDLSQLGRVALAGDFDSISLYQWEGQSQNSFNTNGSQSLLARFPNGAFASLATADGGIQAMCPYTRADGSLRGVMVGGNFTSLGGMESQGIAMFDPNTTEITPLAGLSGRVSALYCDEDSNTVYIGGSFTAPNSTNAIAYTDSDWANLPFGGFNGPVSSITKTSGGNIVFGGDFTGLGNATVPTEKDGQIIPITSANITAGSSSDRDGLGDPENIVCSTADEDGPDSTWLLEDDTPGFWQANFRFGFQPTKLRLWNTNFEDRGTRTFRVTALPLSGIMNFTYTDVDGNEAFCDARCPLPENNSTFQDFSFVNTVGMNGFRVDISDWYGRGGGLSGIKLFQDDIYDFAISEFNVPTCEGDSSASTATTTGPWEVTPSGDSVSEYLTANLEGDINSDSAVVVFRPNIQQSGNYSVSMYTPGCLQDDSCDQRGRVNITGDVVDASGTQSNAPPISTQLFQTNNFDKYDRIYNGFVDAGDSGFQPTITLSPSSDQSGPLTIVAQRVRFELIDSDGGLNGLFEFDPEVTVVDTDFSQSAVNRAGRSLDDDASVNVLLDVDDTLYVGGNFTRDGSKNIFSISDGNVTALEGNGLNSEVLCMYRNGSTIYVGGNFTAANGEAVLGLSGIAAYSINNNRWASLGSGVRGIVTSIIPFTLNITDDTPEPVLAISGSFQELNGFATNDPSPANDFAIWVPSRNNWLQNLDINTIALSGSMSVFTEIPDSEPLFAGAVSSQALQASGAISLNSGASSIDSLPVNFQAQSSSSTVEKRATDPDSASGVVTGLIVADNGLNITVLGGSFAATASNGSTINNLLFLNGSENVVTGVSSGLEPESVVLSLGAKEVNLYVGGALTGNINGNDVGGLIAYDLRGNDFAASQPPALTGDDVIVNAVAPRPDHDGVYVGGSFEGSGSFSCEALCIYNPTSGQWESPNAEISGTVSTMTWVSNDKLIVGGNLTVGGNSTTLATYDAEDQEFTEFTGASNMPGPVTAFSTANSEGSQFWVAGKTSDGATFLQRFDGDEWVPAGSDLGQSTTIRGLQIFRLTEDHSNDDLMGRDEALVLLGQLELPDFGNASAAVFNGTSFTPFILANTAQNGPGSLSQIFVQFPQNFLTSDNGELAVGFVILIGLALALLCTFLLIVGGILVEFWRRRQEGYVPMYGGRNENLSRIPPEELFENVGRRPGGGGL
ncbi:cortical protein marker for cell polarity-domain-containing protein [Lineolata rhizophorae]|uniref:Cortical protein marker for cell polarity-domain-containing protein n=1 Tax=Lineolata rhizophorae TaxID=578093 RepID=A0A6A6P7R7_9PEZI|nr:cortical protein marker for cell polarity-domain-containing protein [Lineolata rhizophorae]